MGETNHDLSYTEIKILARLVRAKAISEGHESPLPGDDRSRYVSGYEFASTEAVQLEGDAEKLRAYHQHLDVSIERLEILNLIRRARGNDYYVTESGVDAFKYATMPKVAQQFLGITKFISDVAKSATREALAQTIVKIFATIIAGGIVVAGYTISLSPPSSSEQAAESTPTIPAHSKPNRQQTENPAVSQCARSLPSHLRARSRAKVSAGQSSVTVWQYPKDQAFIVAVLSAGAEFVVIGDSTCLNGRTLWPIQFDSRISGWITESDAVQGTYFVQPTK